MIKPTNDLCFLNNLFQNVCGKYVHVVLCWLQAHVFKLKTSVCLKLSNIHVYSEVFSGSLPSRVACLQVLVCAFSCSSWSSQGNEFPWCQQSAALLWKLPADKMGLVLFIRVHPAGSSACQSAAERASPRALRHATCQSLPAARLLLTESSVLPVLAAAWRWLKACLWMCWDRSPQHCCAIKLSRMR